MARPPRIEVPGVPLHIVQRGNNRSACFFGDLDRRLYLKWLGHAATSRGCDIHAYVLMSNHVHLLLTPRAQGAASGMLQDLGRRYVRIINKVHGRTGTLWEGRFKSSLIDTERYLFACHRYIELNPVRAGIVHHAHEYAWSSHRFYARGEKNRLITPHARYLALGTNASERSEMFRSLFGDAVADDELVRLRTALNKGWALGSEPFHAEMQRRLGRSVLPPRRGRPKKEIADGPLPPSDQREMLF
jgi:putative transposase